MELPKKGQKGARGDHPKAKEMGLRCVGSAWDPSGLTIAWVGFVGFDPEKRNLGSGSVF